MSWDLDFGNETAAQAEQSASHVASGWYRAVMKTVEDDNGDGSLKMLFAISHGPYRGRVVSQKLKNPRFETDPDKQMKQAQRCKAFAARMGAVPAEAKGTATVNWAVTAGREFIVQIVSREGKGEYAGQVFTELAYLGIYPIAGHKDVPAGVYATLGLTPPAAGSPGATSGGSNASAGAAGGGAAGNPAAPAAPAVTDAAAAALWD